MKYHQCFFLGAFFEFPTSEQIQKLLSSGQLVSLVEFRAVGLEIELALMRGKYFMKSYTVIVLCSFLSMACQKVMFTPDVESMTNASKALPGVDEPTLDVGVRNSGTCNNNESVLSCLKCETPPPPPVVPTLSTKAQKLAKIMALSCPIGNKSYPSDYVSPSATDVKTRLYACTAELYPETLMTANQTSTMAAALDDSNSAMRNRLFAGLWYQPHYSDDFELYFGLTGQEAAYAFCLGRPVAGLLITAEYAKVASDITALERWTSDPAAQARWQAAQFQRQQLLSCLNKPGSAPVDTAPATPAPAPVCEYKSYSGTFNTDALTEISSNLQQGYKVAMETELTCTQVSTVPTIDAFKGKVKIVGYRCQ